MARRPRVRDTDGSSPPSAATGQGNGAAAPDPSLMLGERIRSIRQERGMTLEDVARRAGITKGFMSQVEKGRSNPALQTLRSIARVLDVPLFGFLEDEPDQRVVVRKEDRKRIRPSRAGVEYELLSPDLRRALEMIKMEIPPGKASTPLALSHPGEECATVVRGQAQVELGGTVYDLEEGDTIYFRSEIPHRVINPGRGPLEMISAITPPSF